MTSFSLITIFHIFGSSIALTDFTKECRLIDPLIKSSYKVYADFIDNQENVKRTKISSSVKIEDNNEKYFLKELPVESDEQKILANNELENLKKLNGDSCFPKFFGCHYYLEKHRVYFKIEAFDGDFSSSSPVGQNFNSLQDIKAKLRVFLRMAECVQKMHDLKIVHCDLKPENIVADADNINDIKIIDFGHALPPSFKSLGGTLPFFPPELANPHLLKDFSDDCEMNDMVDFPRDFYALGVVIAELYFGKKKVFKDLRQILKEEQIKCNKIRAVQKVIHDNIIEATKEARYNSSEIETELAGLIRRLVWFNPKTRMSAGAAATILKKRLEDALTSPTKKEKTKNRDKGGFCGLFCFI